MLKILDNFPDIKVTFNLVPSLIEQIREYTEKRENIKDKYLNIMQKRTNELSNDEKIFILKNFFSFYPQTMIKPYPRYYYLYEKRGGYLSDLTLSEKVKIFTNDEFTDLQSYFLLTCFSPIERINDKNIKELLKKAENYTQEDKEYLITKAFDIMDKIIPEFVKLNNEKRIEISTSPFYHPILPLLCDSAIAKTANPDCNIGDTMFKLPEDADAQIKYSLEYFNNEFKFKPKGVWPSEGALSMEVINILIQNKIKWTASDEAILFKSLKIANQRDEYGNMIKPEILYRTYAMEIKKKVIFLFFRDRKISDDIAFKYHKMYERDAIDDFTNYVNQIYQKISNRKEKYILNVIMDGENAWEYYNFNGYYFLNELYSRLSNMDNIQTILPSEFVKFNDYNKLEHLEPGSWINGDFGVWIGHPEDHKSWQYLKNARDDLMNFEKQFPEKRGTKEIINAWKSFHIAEGSDWNWWYGEEHSSLNEADFDKLYRNHLANIYHFLNLEIPAYLLEPITKIKKRGVIKMPTGFISPTIDGKNSTFYEWLKAGYYHTTSKSGTIHQDKEHIISDIYFGFDINNLYLRLDFNESTDVKDYQEIKSTIKFVKPDNIKIEFFIKNHSPSKYFVYKKNFNYFESVAELGDIALNKLIEIKIPFDLIGINVNNELCFFIVLTDENNDIIEVNPDGKPIEIKRPAREFESIHWRL
jgi:alpha-amylase/alpha-mannosidase (GH57 family)